MGINILNNKTFLITGATGCLGSQMTCRLEELGAKVFPLITPGYPEIPKRFNWKAKVHPIKLESEEILNKLLSVDYVINFHWRTDRNLRYSNQLLYEINENINKLEFLWIWILKNTKEKFINISSINTYSYLNDLNISDDTEPKPISAYGIAKICAEKYFDAFFCNTSFRILHIRLCSVISNGEHPSHLVNQLYESTFNDKQIFININHANYMMHAEEAIDYIISASIKSIGKINLVKNKYTNEEIAAQFYQYTGKKLNAIYEDQIKGVKDLSFKSDIQKLNASWIRKLTLDQIISSYISSKTCLDEVM